MELVHTSGASRLCFFKRFRCKFNQRFAPELVNKTAQDCKLQTDMCEPSLMGNMALAVKLNIATDILQRKIAICCNASL